MFNLLNIQKRQQQQQGSLEDDFKGNNSSSKTGFTGKNNYNDKNFQQKQTDFNSKIQSSNQFDPSQNVYQIRSNYGKVSTQNINKQNIEKSHSKSSHQLKRISSAMKVSSMNMLSGNDDDFDNDSLPYQQILSMPAINHAFPNFPNKFKKERIATNIMNSKYIKKIGPRPETGVRVNSAQQMQQKYMDMFNQPKNLFNQIVSIEETSHQSKKFFTENRVKTASTRSQTHKEIESLADIKDFKSIMEGNVQKRQIQNQEGMTFATIDRARTANELYRKTNIQKKVNIQNQELENIADQSESQSRSGQQIQLPPRAETAYHPQLSQNAISATSLQKELNKFNGDVNEHLKRHMKPKSQNNLIPASLQNEKPQTANSIPYQRQQLNNNFVDNQVNQQYNNDKINKPQESEAHIKSKQKINFQSGNSQTKIENRQEVNQRNLEFSSLEKGSKIYGNIDSALKEKLKIDLTKSNIPLQPKSQSHQTIKSPHGYSQTPKSFKGQHPTPKIPNKTLKNPPQSHLIEPQDSDFDAQNDEIVYRLNLKSNTLTKGELNYIIKKRKQFQQDLEPHMNLLQKEFDNDDIPTKLSPSKKKITFSAIEQQTIMNLDHSAHPNRTAGDQDSTSNDIEIMQENVVEPEKFFFDHQNNIHDQLKSYGEELREKFEKYHEEDQLDFQRFKQKKEQFIFNFLNTNEEGVSQHELDLVIEEYKQPPQERDYEFLDTIAERLKFFKRFTKPTRLYLLKLANIIQYPANQVIFNQGDEGDLMYVIIRGACHVRIKRLNPDGKEDNLVVATLYDGQQFGELALMSTKKPQNLVKSIKANELGQIRISQIKKELEKQPLFNGNQEQNNNNEDNQSQPSKQKIQKKNSDEDINKMLEDANKSASKRAATIETCEITTLFTVSRDYFKTILLGLIQKELDVKLKLLQSISFFEYMDQVSLIPLANLVEVKKYKLGEILVREGQEPNNFYIVSSGRLKIIKEEIIVRSNFVMGREHKFSKKKLNFGTRDYTKVIPEDIKIKKSTLVDNTKRDSDSSSDFEEEEDNDAPLKAANYETIYTDDQNIAYKYQHEFGSLVRGDFFFGRSILYEYLKVDPAAIDEYSIDPSERAKLTVIADSAEIEVYILEKDKIHLIPNLLRRTMIDGLIARKEFDSIYTQEVSLWSKQWDKYKSNVLETIKVNSISKKALK